MKASFFRIIMLTVLSVLAGCSSTSNSHTASGSGQPYYKVGQPYQVNGQWYTPQEDYSYDETGIASWYGEGFHGGTTANGEVFNKNELTAAHKTLPLPTLARVTNLDNGREIVVRINDRGPFSGARIIDVSERSAQLLGFEKSGTAKVRVQVLADESKAIADAMRHYNNGPATTELAAANVPVEKIPPASPSDYYQAGQPMQLAQEKQGYSEPSVQSAELPPVERKQLEPVRTTPAVHEQLLETKPVPVVNQVQVTGGTNIYVQAGAFTLSDNAQKLKQQLSSLGPTTISNIVVNGKMFYRVRVGPIPSVDKADAMLKRVRDTGATGARTVVD